MSKQKKQGGGDGESPFETLCTTYEKMFKNMGIPMYPAFQEKMNQMQEDDVEFEQLHLWEPTNPNALQVIFAAIHEAKIDTLKSIRFWKIKAQDEGVRALSKFMMQNNEGWGGAFNLDKI